MTQRNNNLAFDSTPLHHAVENNIEYEVIELLASCADPFLLDHRDNTPLSLAMKNRNTRLQALLLSVPFMAKETLTDPVKLLHYNIAFVCVVKQGHYLAVKDCLELGVVDVNFLNPDPALTYAMKNNHEDIFKLLLLYGANPVIEVSGYHPLMDSVYYNYETYFTLMMDNVVAKKQTLTKDCIKRLLVLAVDKGRVGILKKLLRDVNAEYLLLEACGKGNLNRVLVLIAAGVDVNCLDPKFKCTPLMNAASHHFPKVVSALITAGAIVDIQTGSHNSALHKAVFFGYTDNTKQLLDAGADVNIIGTKHAYPPLFNAIEQDRAECAELLLARGADLLWKYKSVCLLQIALTKKNFGVVVTILKHLATQTTPDNIIEKIKMLKANQANGAQIGYYLAQVFMNVKDFADVWDNYKAPSTLFAEPMMDKILHCLFMADCRERDHYMLREFCEQALEMSGESLRATLFSAKNTLSSTKVINGMKEKYRAKLRGLEETHGKYPPRYKDINKYPADREFNPAPSAPVLSGLRW